MGRFVLGGWRRLGQDSMNMTQLQRVTRQTSVRRYQLVGTKHLYRLTSTQENIQSDDIVSGPYDLIGPPRPGSNLRPIKFSKQADESDLQNGGVTTTENSKKGG